MFVCVDAIRLFQIATPTVFLRFSQNLAHMISVPICKNCETHFWNFDFKIFGKFL